MKVRLVYKLNVVKYLSIRIGIGKVSEFKESSLVVDIKYSSQMKTQCKI